MDDYFYIFVIIVGIIVLVVGYIDYNNAIKSMNSTAVPITSMVVGGFLILFGLILAIDNYKRKPTKLITPLKQPRLIRQVAVKTNTCGC